MGAVRADENGVQLTGPIMVGGVAARAGQQPAILAAACEMLRSVHQFPLSAICSSERPFGSTPSVSTVTIITASNPTISVSTPPTP